MKTVFSKSEIAHIFAHRSQSEARTSSNNFSIYGDKCYSYSTVIARHCEGFVLISDKKYSNTTSGQQSLLRSACSHLDIVYCYEVGEGDEYNNIRLWIGDLEALCKGLVKARKPENYILEIEQLKAKVFRYAEYMGVEVQAEMVTLFDSKDFTQYNVVKAEQQAIREREAKIKLEKQYKKELSEWKSGKRTYMYNYKGKNDQLKVVNDIIHTTQGVKIAKDKALLMYEALKAGRLSEGMRVTDVNNHSYTINEVSKVVRIGCHTFKKSYLLTFGKNLI